MNEEAVPTKRREESGDREDVLSSDGPGGWAVAAAVADLVAASEKPVEVEVLHVNEVDTMPHPRGLTPIRSRSGASSSTNWWPTCGSEASVRSAESGPASSTMSPTTSSTTAGSAGPGSSP